MARTRANNSSTSREPGLMSRLRRRHNAEVTTKESTNPITGTHTVTKKTKTHPQGLGHHGHAGRGPLAGEGSTTANANKRTTLTTGHHHKRRPSVGDKVSGAMMKLKGSLTRRPGLKVSKRKDGLYVDGERLTARQAAGTRRMHGTDGRNSRHRF